MRFTSMDDKILYLYTKGALLRLYMAKNLKLMSVMCTEKSLGYLLKYLISKVKLKIHRGDYSKGSSYHKAV